MTIGTVPENRVGETYDPAMAINMNPPIDRHNGGR
jgi:hypothetical protein